VADQEILAIDGAFDRFAVHDHTGLLRHVIEDPHVVVADEEMHGNAAIGQLRELAQEAHIALGARRSLYSNQKSNRSPMRMISVASFAASSRNATMRFSRTRLLRRIRHAKVEVAEEVDAVAG
jgi:hypothetical protein